MTTVLAISEDSSRDAFFVVQALTKQILRYASEGRPIHHVDYLPLREPDAEQAVRGNLFKSREPRDRQKRIALMRELLRQVLMEGGFVVYHIDGDRVWAQREQSENRSKFSAFIEELIRNHSDERDPRRQYATLRDAFARRLILMMPFYSIEAWLYQNTERALALCDEHYRGRDRERFEAWSAQRNQLDEVLKPKAQVAFGGQHNRELAEARLPMQAMYNVGKSFSETVDRFLACGALLAAADAGQAGRSSG